MGKSPESYFTKKCGESRCSKSASAMASRRASWRAFAPLSMFLGLSVGTGQNLSLARILVSPPPLPKARAEDKLVWNRTHDADIVRRPLPVAPTTPRKLRSSVLLLRSKGHPLTTGARELFT